MRPYRIGPEQPGQPAAKPMNEGTQESDVTLAKARTENRVRFRSGRVPSRVAVVTILISSPDLRTRPSQRARAEWLRRVVGT